MRRRLIFALSLAAILGTGSIAHSQNPTPTRASLTKPGFRFPAEAPIKILLVRADIKVVEQTAAGLRQPSADLTLLARENLKKALTRRLNQQNIAPVNLPETPASDAAFVADYQSLLKTVVDTVIKHRLLSTDLLPTKTGQLGWSLGNSGTRLIEMSGADYALFIHMYDTLDAPGRQSAANVAGIMGRSVSAELHSGYAGLVDLRTGDLVWMNINLKMKGDVRQADGADRRIVQLLERFPAISPVDGARKSHPK